MSFGRGAVPDRDRNCGPLVSVFRQSSAIGPKLQGGDTRSHRIDAYRSVILNVVEAQKDITLVERSKPLRRDHDVSFAPSTLWRFVELDASDGGTLRAEMF